MRGVWAAALAISLALGFYAGALADAPPPGLAFPQDHSPLKPDPSVRYGRLDNGLTYILTHHQTPRGEASMRMRIASGSMMEQAGRQGLAHFLEHMAFEGSTHIVGDGELVKFLQRHGFKFGADANAFTYDNKTEYVLELPKTDDETVDAALFMMRETASALTFDAAAIDRQRGVVLGEERLRDSPGLHETTRWNAQVYAGQKFADFNLPIGRVEDIKTLQKADLEAFYHAWYRPETTTLVIAGDIDVDKIEAKLRATFGDWRAQGPAPAPVDYGVYRPKGVTTFDYQEQGLVEVMTATWIKPFSPRDDTAEKSLQRLESRMLILTLNRRLSRMVEDPSTAFVQASLETGGHDRTSATVTLLIVPKPGQAKRAFEQAYQALHQFLQGGVTEAEVETLHKVLPVMKRNVEEAYPTRRNDDIVRALTASLESGIVYRPLADQLAEYDALEALLSKPALDARLKVLFSGDGPVLSHWGETLSGFDAPAMKASYALLTHTASAGYVSAAVKPWPYTDFGAPVQPQSRAVNRDFGYTQFVFPNGVKLNVLQTHLVTNAVLVQVDFGGGLLRFDPKSGRPFPLATSALFTDGGLGKLNRDEMNTALIDKRFNLRYTLSPTKASFNGATSTTDFPTQMQVMMAYAVDPAFRPEAYARWKALTPQMLQAMHASPGGVLGFNIQNILRGDDPRTDPRIFEHLDAVKFDDVQAFLRETVTDTPVEVTIVGDISEAAAVREVGKTFALLPQRPETAARSPGADRVTFPPQKTDFVLTHRGRQDQSLSEVIWPTTDFYADTVQSRVLTVLAQVFSQRLSDEVREKQGAAYSAEAFSYQDDDYKGFGYFAAEATIAAGGDAAFRASVARIAADLRARPISDDELLRAKKPLQENIDNQYKSVNFWLDLVSRTSGDPRAATAALNRRSQYAKVTAADLQAAARLYLLDGKAFHISVLPETAMSH